MVRELKLGPALFNLSSAGAFQGQWTRQCSAALLPCSRQLPLFEQMFLPLLQPTAAATEPGKLKILSPYLLLLSKFREVTWHRENGGMFFQSHTSQYHPLMLFSLLWLQLPTKCIMMDSYPLSKEGFEHHRQFSQNSSMATSCQKRHTQCFRKRIENKEENISLTLH